MHRNPLQSLRWNRLIVWVTAASVVLHLGAAVVASLWKVPPDFPPMPADFEITRQIGVAAREREHRANMARFDEIAARPVLMEVLAPEESATPSLPELPIKILPLTGEQIAADEVAAMVGRAAGETPP